MGNLQRAILRNGSEGEKNVGDLICCEILRLEVGLIDTPEKC